MERCSFRNSPEQVMANSKKNSQGDKRSKPAAAARTEAAKQPAATATAPQPPPPAPAKAQPRADAQARQQPSQDQIAKRAYQIFQARGGQHGRHAEDWKQAEQELKLGTQ
ncbi:MAG: hypothetical protein NVSMB23_15260 [Myxococcales bacterium]